MKKKLKSSAFTLLELVFVIVVIGILSAVIIPSTKTNPLREAATQLISHIRYTQHLAMVDDRYGSSNEWYKGRWHIAFVDNKYSILSNTTYAKDTMNNGKNIQDIDLSADYHASIAFSGGCPSGDNNIIFDNMGRPMLGVLNNYTSAYKGGATETLLLSTCIITLSSSGEDDVILRIRPETGYVSVDE